MQYAPRGARAGDGAGAVDLVTRTAGPRLFDESLQPATWTRADAALYDNGVTYLKLTPAS